LPLVAQPWNFVTSHAASARSELLKADRLQGGGFRPGARN
jgi:hypothetical protein